MDNNLTMPLDLGPISFETFCSTYWRRRPLHIPGGARHILEEPVEPPRFLAACERMERLAPHLLFRRGPELAFVQRVDLADGPLHRVCERFAGWTSGAQIWFDGVYAREGMGIGSHFDYADTFLLQQRGTKLWRLHPPDLLPEETIRRRLLNETEVDAMAMPDGALEFRLEEGDLLYLPLLWIHWGISEGESLSLSLCFTARPALDCLALAEGVLGAGADARAALWRACYPRPTPPQVPAAPRLPPDVRAALAGDARWWRPLPVIWTVEGEAAIEAATRAEAERHVDALAASLSDHAALVSRRGAPPAGAAAERTAPPVRYGPPPAGRGEPVPLPGLDELLREAAALPNPELDPACLAAPDDAFGAADRLGLRVARRAVGRFLRIVQRCHEWIRTEAPRAALHTLVRALARMPADQRARALRHTALRGWSWRAAEAIQFGYVPRLEAIVAELPRLLLPSLLEADALAPGDSLPVTPGTARSLQLLAWGVAIPTRGAPGEVLEARRAPDGLVLAGGGGALRLAPDGPGRPWRPADAPAERLAPAWPGGPPICGDDAWIHGFFPGPARARGLALRGGAGPQPDAALAGALAEGRAWLARAWPAWEPRVAAAFELVVRREDTAGPPPPETTRAFPGLLAAAPRAPEAMARALVSEAARRLAHDALDGLSLVEETPREAFLSFGGRGASRSERLAELLARALVLEVLPDPERDPGSAAGADVDALRAAPGLTGAGATLLEALARRLAHPERR